MGRTLALAARHQHGAAALVLAVVLTWCYTPVLFDGKTLQAPMYTTSGVVPGWPPGDSGRRVINTFNVDIATPAFYEWPINRYIGETLRRGQLPLWNPHQAAGTPLVVNYSTRVFFPYQLLVNVSPLRMWDFFFVLRLWIAGWLTFCFLARAGLGWTPATLGAIFYMLSGVFTWFINLEQFVNPAMTAPLFFLTVESFVAAPDSRRAAYVASAIGLNLLAGQPEVTLYVLTAGGLYGILRWLAARGGRHRALRIGGWAVVAVIVGFGLAAPLLLPFAAHQQHAIHLHPSGGDMGVRDPASPVMAIALFVPTFFQIPTLPRYRPDNGLWDFLGGYGGILSPFLLLAGLLAPARASGARSRAALLFFAGVWIVIELKNFGAPPFHWIGYLPLFDQVWTPRWTGPTWCFALSAGAAFGVERLCAVDNEQTRFRAVVLLSLTFVLVGVALLAAFSIHVWGPVLIEHWSFVLPSAFAGLGLAAVVLALAAQIVLRLRGAVLAVALIGLAAVERWFPIPRGYAPTGLGLSLLPVALGLLAVALVIFRRHVLAGIAAVAALVAGPVIDHHAPFGLPVRRDPAPPPPVVQFLREHGGYARIVGDRRVLAPNYASVFGLYDVRFVEALAVKWFDNFVVEGLETSERIRWYSLWFIGEPDRFEQRGEFVYLHPGLLEEDLRRRLRGYSLLGVRYIVMPPEIDVNSLAKGDSGRFPIVYRGEVVVYENPAALPRAFVVGDWEPASDDRAARSRALSGTFDLQTRAVVEGAPSRPGGGKGRAQIIEYRANAARLDIETDGPALVVLTDTFYPGWHAWVDGVPTDVYRVNGVVRGVFVDGGRHEIWMRFFPLSQAVGFAIGGVAIVLVVVMISRAGLPRAPTVGGPASS